MGKYFNFAHSVELVRQQFPEETGDITFVNTRHPEQARRLMREWIEEASSVTRMDIQRHHGGESAYIDDLMQDPACAVCDEFSGKKMLIMNRERLEKTASLKFFDDQEKEHVWTFLHELSHLIMKGGIGHCFGLYAADERTKEKRDHSRNQYEHRADLLSCLIGLQCGLLEPKDIKRLALVRSMDCVQGDFEHMTGHALDRLAIDTKNGISPHIRHQSLMAAVEDYMQVYAPSLDDFTQSKKFLTERLCSAEGLTPDKDNPREIDMKDVISACKDAPADSMAFYAIARTLRPFINGNHLQEHAAPEELEDLKQTIFQKSIAFGNDGLLANFADRPTAPVAKTTSLSPKT